MLRRFTLAGIAALALTFFGVTAPASAYVPVGPNPIVVAPGGTIPVTFSTPLEPGTPVTIVLTGENAAGATLAADLQRTGVVAADGSVPVRLTLPATAKPGSEYALTVSGNDGVTSYSATQYFTVAGVPADGPVAAGPGGIAVTGGVDMTAATWFGTGALVLGAAAVIVVARIRMRQTA